jgi:hypothetical protein
MARRKLILPVAGALILLFASVFFFWQQRVRHNPWYMLVIFDESGNISHLGAHRS